ncbi:GNAT family N-acetyltransferase [Lentibacillus sediminis]|uniref:GNAT family N-acetyltransferase n=1 Tax=Lentibacillus sediminis TaxID=1940529 RepID=UPI001EFDE53A|nr:GNAT family N-acetyltransferase [Lentibacillus sediminis]
MSFRDGKMGDFTVRKAEEADTPAVTAILKSAADWLAEKGIAQWSYLRSGGEDEEIRQDILCGTTYIVEYGETAVATFNFSPKQNSWDVEMWGDRQDAAYYIHRLAVAWEWHHRQIGRKLLEWLDENLEGETRLIRLDCVADNPALNAFYQQAGYEFIGYAGEGEDKFSLYEKMCGQTR